VKENLFPMAADLHSGCPCHADEHAAIDHTGCSGHHHTPNLQDSSGTRLLVTLALNFIIPIAQIIGGVMANSVALISDAMHNFSDFTALLISYMAFRIGRKGATESNTFGYKRAEILAALINVLLLFGASMIILYHAILRFWEPHPVNGLTVIILAGVGVVGNGLSALLLHQDAAHSLNARGAFLHMLGDLMTSVVVLITGFLFLFYPWYWLDPVLSVLIVIFILKNGWSLLKESTSVLMNATPNHVQLEKIRGFLTDLPGVLGVHYLHAWQVSTSSTAFSCHVVVPDQAVSGTSRISDRIKHELWHRFHIDHPVLQFETADCGNGTLLCEMACNGNPGEIRNAKTEAPLEQTMDRRRFQFIVFHTLRLLMAAVFLYASYDKILHPQAFAQAVYNYQILPDAAVNLVALTLPVLELFLGMCLLSGIWLPGATLLSTFLLSVFIGALVFNRIRGLDIHCGCFSTETSGGPASLWTVARDLLFWAVSIYLTIQALLFGPPGRITYPEGKKPRNPS
jgi:cobalt-zinc-cadmium efflux system protein